MKYSLKIATIKGIPVKLHVSFLFIVVLLTVFLSIQTFSVLGMKIGFGDLDMPVALKWVLGALTALVLLFTLFLHELSHSLVSIANGFKVKEITFFLLGGVSRSESFPEDPATEIKIAAIGPLVSMGLGFLFILLNRASTLLEGDPESALGYAVIFFGTLGFYNFIIGMFNLIPALPLDGGRIFRGILGNFMDHRNATIKATQVGKVLAVIMGLVGILSFNFLLILIAVFIYMGAKGEKDTVDTMHSLEGLKMSQVMSGVPGTVEPDTTLSEVRKKMMKNRKRVQLVKDQGKIIGIVTAENLREVPKKHRGSTTAGEVMDRDFIKAGPKKDAPGIWNKMVKRGKDRVVIIDHDKVVGVASLADFRSIIEFRESLG